MNPPPPRPPHIALYLPLVSLEWLCRVDPSLYWIQGVEADMEMTIICCLTVSLAVQNL